MKKTAHSDEKPSEQSHERQGMTFEEAEKQESTLTFTSRQILHKIGIIETLFHEGHSGHDLLSRLLRETATLTTPTSNVGLATNNIQLTKPIFGMLSSMPRRNHLSLTPDERKQFNKAIELTISTGAYNALVAIHSDMSHNHHGSSMAADPVLGRLRFLSWHRVYLFELERLLTKGGMRIPYWDWANDHELPTWVHLPANVTRGPDTSKKLPDQSMVDTMVLNKSTYTPFTTALEDSPFHNRVHMWVGGTMQEPMISPRDPIFWLHHANVDRIWAQWQENHIGQLPPLSGVNAIMDPWTLRVDDVISTFDLRYYYE